MRALIRSMRFWLAILNTLLATIWLLLALDGGGIARWLLFTAWAVLAVVNLRLAVRQVNVRAERVGRHPGPVTWDK